MPDRTSPIALRRLEARDLAAALAIQAQSYPAFLREDEAAFASRLDLLAGYCLAAERDGRLIAYLLAHGWPRAAPPAIGDRLDPAAPSQVLYIHDLAVSPEGRGVGAGRALVDLAFDLASHDGLTTAELIAVEGAAPYGRALGFTEPSIPPALAATVAAYGPAARWMSRPLAPRD